MSNQNEKDAKKLLHRARLLQMRMALHALRMVDKKKAEEFALKISNEGSKVIESSLTSCLDAASDLALMDLGQDRIEVRRPDADNNFAVVGLIISAPMSDDDIRTFRAFVGGFLQDLLTKDCVLLAEGGFDELGKKRDDESDDDEKKGGE